MMTGRSACRALHFLFNLHASTCLHILFILFALTLFYRLIELFYARQEQANVSVASVREICAMIKLCAVSTLSSALNMGARPDELDESGART